MILSFHVQNVVKFNKKLSAKIAYVSSMGNVQCNTVGGGGMGVQGKGHNSFSSAATADLLLSALVNMNFGGCVES